MPDEKPRLVLSRPKDKSLESFKAWIQGVVKAINPNAKDTTTEEQWIESWKKFWSKAEKPSD
jgi:hypothetical protein